MGPPQKQRAEGGPADASVGTATPEVVGSGIGGTDRASAGVDTVVSASSDKRKAGAGKAGTAGSLGCTVGGALVVADQTPLKKPRPLVPAFRELVEPAVLLRQEVLPPPRPEDNYEISEPGDASEDEQGAMSQERDRSQKHVPAWCATYLQDLARQASIDPDSIFGSRVPVCDLESIFPDPLYVTVGQEAPKRKRGSSGDWEQDKLTRAEVREYKRRMGQTGNWRKQTTRGTIVGAGAGASSSSSSASRTDASRAIVVALPTPSRCEIGARGC